MSLTNDEINKIRDEADIVDILRNYLTIEQKGKSYKAICPFHDDRNPSLSIAQDKQIYKCFVCGNGGNVFTFVQNYEHISFKESVFKVAELIGYKLDHKYLDYEKKVDPEKKKIYDVLTETIKYAKYTLHSQDGFDQMQYLKKRGIIDEVADRFEIGYVGIDNSLYKYLSAKQYSDEAMVSANLIRVGTTGAYDVFNDRIVFPIHDIHGNPVGFTARTLNQSDSKYINTAETLVYKKGELLYNYHRALTSMKKEGVVYLVEGVMDVIAFYKAGIIPVVASLGTALTTNQIGILKKLNIDVVLAYDGDQAGLNATYKAGKLLQEKGLNFKVMKTHFDLDPDDVIEKYGKDELVALTSQKLVWLEFVFDYMQRKYDLSNYSEKKEFAFEIENEIALLRDDFDRQNFAHRLQQLTGFKVSSKVAIIPDKVYKDVRINTRIQEGYLKSEEIILKQMLSDPQAISKFKEELGFLLDDVHQRLALNIIDYYRKHGNIDISSLLDENQDSNYQKLLMKLSLADEVVDHYDEALFDGAKRTIKLKMIEQQAEQVRDKIKSVLNDESRVLLMNELHELQLERRRLIEDEKS